MQATRRSALQAAAAARSAATEAARVAAIAEEAALAFEHEVNTAARVSDARSRQPELDSGALDSRAARLALALRVEAASHRVEMRAAREETSEVESNLEAVDAARATIDAAITQDGAETGRPTRVAEAIAALQCNGGIDPTRGSTA
jgi:hypothetical protein